ncbi:MAG TPA: ABC transporter permease [Candidatus Acidoferrales bacterium]|nr:ABC transporter permease [Candidatus Acidoferrales bacterium]
MTRRRRALADLDQDIREHLERETQENIERGMSPADARAAALRKFGNVGLIEEQTRAVWRRPWIDQFWQDLLFAFRILRRAPGFTAIAVLTLAVGIGLNTAVFSVVNSVLMRPLEYPHAERLVWLGEYDPAVGHDMVTLSDAAAWRTTARSFDQMASYSFQQSTVATSGTAFPVAAVLAGGDFWSLTGATPPLGRLFGPNERDGMVISWDVFQRQFGGDAHLVGSAVTVDGRAATIRAVLPRNFRFQFPRWWTALHPEPLEAYLTLPAETERRGGQVVASLKPGVSVSQAFVELQSLQRALHPPNPSNPASPGTLHVDRLHDQLTSGTRRALSILLAAGVLVLLMVSANTASLLLARAASRRRELAIRLAIGAGRFRALRQLLVESLALAFLGGAVGLLLARWMVLLVVRLGPASIPRLNEASIDLRVLAFTFSITLAAGILFGIAPGFQLWRTGLHEALKEGARGAGGRFGLRIRRVLVAGELALALMLLTGAGLLLASFLRMSAKPAAFTPEKVLVMKVRLPGPQYSRAMQQRYRDELMRRLGAIPGVEATGVISAPLMFCCTEAFPADTNPNQTHLLHLSRATPGYFRALGMELRKGRWLADSEKGDAILLNESMAREAFGSADPIGHTLKVPEPRVVAGVISDLRYTRLDAGVVPEIFLPVDERMTIGFSIAVRAASLAGIPAAVRREMAAIDPSVPPYDVKTLEEALAESISSQRFNLFLLGSFALAAFVLALVGIYGVVTYSVAARTREIGVRVALGAQRGNVIGMVVAEGMMLGLAGIVVGLAASYPLTRLMTSLLYGIKATDPRIFAAASAILVLTVLFASWWPARNAASIEPVIALRDE